MNDEPKPDTTVACGRGEFEATVKHLESEGYEVASVERLRNGGYRIRARWRPGRCQCDLCREMRGEQ